MPSPPAELESVAAHLGGCRVLVPHLPGYGATPACDGGHAIAQVEARLVAALRERAVERPVLVGFSMGAYRALSLALSFDVKAVVTLGGFADLSAEEREGMQGFAAALRGGTDLRSMFPARFLSPDHRESHPSSALAVEAWADAAPAHVVAAELDDLVAAPSLLPRLGALDCPVVARAGTLDEAVPVHHAAAIVAAVSDGHLELVPNAGHALFIEDLAGTVATLRRECEQA